MCGINGIFAFRNSVTPIDQTELVRTRDHMISRGPDAAGLWISEDQSIGFGHRRLAIIDLTDSGSQPMVCSDHSLVITFNGEIYNFRELRRRLEAKGYVFKSNSDTEVLLHLYAEKGHAMVNELRGMFAFGIWDARRRELFMARDVYGIKPLYYANDGGAFRFASQVKSLVAGGAVSRKLDAAGTVGFHVFGSVPDPFTIYRSIRALPAGSHMVIRSNGQQLITQYNSIADIYVTAEDGQFVSQDERQEAIREMVLDSVRHHLVSDVPVGAFLSAGIDSGALVGLMRDAGQSEIETVTLSFDEFGNSANDEAPIAAEVARTYGTSHVTRNVTKEEFLTDLPLILASMDQPSVDGINSWFVSKVARERGLKVALSGLGGDELFGGYPSFRDIPRWVRWLSMPSAVPYLGDLFRRTMMRMGPSRIRMSPKSAGIIQLGGSFSGAWLLRRGLFMPYELEGLLPLEEVEEGLARLNPVDIIEESLSPKMREDFNRVATMEASLYMRNQLLRDTDWASMAHSLEVRTPLVDVELVGRIAALGPPPKKLSAKIELALTPEIALPRSVIDRKKTGFATPVGSWLHTVGSKTGGGVYDYTRNWARHVAVEQLKRPSP